MQSNILKGVSVKGIRIYRVQAEGATSEDPVVIEESVEEQEEDLAIQEEINKAVYEESERNKLEREEIERFRDEVLAEANRLKAEILKEAADSKEEAGKEGYKEGYSEGHKQGHKEGYDSGYKEGKAEALNEFEGIKEEARGKVKQAQDYLIESKNRSREIIASSEKTLVELAMAVAEKLLRDQLDISPEKVVNIVKEAINRLPDGDLIKVYVNDKDLPVCLKNQEKLEEGFQRVRTNFKNIEFLPGEDISRGSCRVESESGAVEFLLEEEKEQLKEELMELARKEEQKQLEEEEISDE